jgi:iron complex transport system ATP-binding protein
MAILSATSVTFHIAERTLLDSVSLALEPGEVVGLIGANGAGKSTLLKVLCGMRKLTSGQVMLCGKPISQYTSRDVARLIGQVHQSAVMDAPFSIYDVVAMGRNPHLTRFEVERPRDRQIVNEAMQHTNTLDLAERTINTLSSGERQRVFLARALAQEPSILLLDEPTSNLDIRHQLEILTLVQNLAHQRGLGVIIAIHDLSLAARFCDRLILLHDGRIVADGKPESVLTPENVAQAFGVFVQPYFDPFTNDLKLSIRVE